MMRCLHAEELRKLVVIFTPGPSKVQESGVSISEGRRWMSLLKQRAIHPSSAIFVLFRLLTDWTTSTCNSQDDIYSVCRFKCKPLTENPSQTYPEMFYKLSGII